jgi:hypothetical protein
MRRDDHCRGRAFGLDILKTYAYEIEAGELWSRVGWARGERSLDD